MPSDSDHQVDGAAPERLAALLGVSRPDARLWQPDELGALLRHQLAAPVEVELGRLPPAEARQLRILSEAQALLLKSYADLLLHPCPPVGLLRLVKDFGKAVQAAPVGPLPPDLGRALYFASIAAALGTRNERITRMDDAALRRGLGWLRDQPWMTPELRALAERGLAALASHGPPPPTE